MTIRQVMLITAWMILGGIWGTDPSLFAEHDPAPKPAPRTATAPTQGLDAEPLSAFGGDGSERSMTEAITALVNPNRHHYGARMEIGRRTLLKATVLNGPRVWIAVLLLAVIILASVQYGREQTFRRRIYTAAGLIADYWNDNEHIKTHWLSARTELEAVRRGQEAAFYGHSDAPPAGPVASSAPLPESQLVTNLREDIRQLTAIIGQKDERITLLSKEAKDSADALRQKNVELEQLSGRVQDADELIRGLQAKLAENNKNLLPDYLERIRTLQAAMEQLEIEKAAIRQEVHKAEAEKTAALTNAEELVGANRRLTAENERLKRRVSALEGGDTN